MLVNIYSSTWICCICGKAVCCLSAVYLSLCAYDIKLCRPAFPAVLALLHCIHKCKATMWRSVLFHAKVHACGTVFACTGPHVIVFLSCTDPCCTVFACTGPCAVCRPSTLPYDLTVYNAHVLSIIHVPLLPAKPRELHTGSMPTPYIYSSCTQCTNFKIEFLLNQC